MAWNIDTVEHPGFPKIGAIETFRKNTELEIEKGNAALNQAIQKMPQYKAKKITHSGKDALRMRKKQAHPELINKPAPHKDTPFTLNTFVNKSEWKAGSEHIKQEIEQKMREFMQQSMLEARDKSRRQIDSMTRAFKSKMKPSTPTVGDIYDVIADSLDFEETHPKDDSAGRNQFISFMAASREAGATGTLYNTGVRGSRMNQSDRSLIELTEEGWPGFTLNKIGAYFMGIQRNPAKRLRER